MDNFNGYKRMVEATHDKITHIKHTMVNKMMNARTVTQEEYHEMHKVGIHVDRRARVAKLFAGLFYG